MKSITILGLDIGGANTKAALVKFKDKKILEADSTIEYFPFWQQALKDIPNIFKRINKKLIQELAPGGGYIFSSGHSINPAVTLDRYLAYINVREKYGNYPIKI